VFEHRRFGGLWRRVDKRRSFGPYMQTLGKRSVANRRLSEAGVKTAYVVGYPPGLKCIVFIHPFASSGLQSNGCTVAGGSRALSWYRDGAIGFACSHIDDDIHPAPHVHHHPARHTVASGRNRLRTRSGGRQRRRWARDWKRARAEHSRRKWRELTRHCRKLRCDILESEIDAE
jgi:hypothetical protein